MKKKKARKVRRLPPTTACVSSLVINPITKLNSGSFNEPFSWFHNLIIE